MYKSEYEKFADQVLVKVDGGAEPSIGDGKTYKRSPWWQSPEGNFYGDRRRILEYYSGWVWNGETYIELQASGMQQSRDYLPKGPRLHFEIWQVTRPGWPVKDENGLVRDSRAYDYYYYDTVTQDWLEISWHNEIYGKENLPRPGLKVGAAHLVIEQDFEVFWDGFAWRLPSHKNLRDDQPERHVPEGFITNYTTFVSNTNGAFQFLEDSIDEELRSRISEARLEFISKNSLGLVGSVIGSTGALWVSGELLLVSMVTPVSYNSQVVHFADGELSYSDVQPETEYYVYCGNNDFPISRGLFLSLDPDVNGRLGSVAPVINARIVGKVETDSEGYFIREIDMSFIGKRVEFSQTYWEYSDYQLQFVDQDTLAFNRIDGTHGLCYVNGQLLNLGSGKEVLRSDYRIDWNNGNPILDTSGILSSTLYQIYIANDSYEYNFNDIGDDGFPRDEGDPGYVSAKDFRRRLFLSTKVHDHRLFDEQYPGYYARHIGQILTDSNAYFKYSSDISLIRQPTLNPTHLDGLAEIAIEYIDDSQFKIIRKKGTTGLVYVGGKPTQTYSSDDPRVHVVSISNYIYTYDEGNISAPLTSTGVQLTAKVGFPAYLYMANSSSCWGGLVNGVFLSMQAPTGGYLSSNWPGNNARWLLTLNLSPLDKGAELVANGTFATNASWTWGSGWSHNAVDQLAAHSSGTAALSQSISVTTSDYCYVTFSTSSIDTGSVVFKLGSNAATMVSTSGSNVFYMFPNSGSLIEFVPTTDFDGNVDNVSVKKITTGNFSGNFIIDATTGVNTVIDDGIVSADKTWSSLRIQREISRAITMMTASVGFDNQKIFGLPLRLEYSSPTQARLYPVGTDRPIIAFPDLTTREIPNAGIYLDIDGDPLTLYYVYLSETSLIMSTLAPDTTYAKMKTRGEEYVLVGYAGCSATDAIAGNWNIFSLYGEPSREWTVNITSSSPTTLNIPGIVCLPGKAATIQRTGISKYYQTAYCSCATGYNGYASKEFTLFNGDLSVTYYLSFLGETSVSACCVNGSQDGSTSCYFGEPAYSCPKGWNDGGILPTAHLSVLLNNATSYPTYANGVFGGVLTLTHSLSCDGSVYSHGGYCYHVTSSCYWHTINGQLKVTRPAGDW